MVSPVTSRVRPDVVINNVRYVLWRDPKRGPAWWRAEGKSLQEGDSRNILSAVWQDWSGGMGETRRVAPDSTGYAYSERIDCSTSGFARLAAAPQAITPTSYSPNIIEAIASGSFELGGYIYFGMQTKLYKINRSTKSIVEVVTKANGAVGRCAQFNGKWYVPWGASVLFTELTTQAPALLKQFYYNGTTYTDNTTAASEIDGSAFTLLSGASDFAYWGAATTFTALGFDISVAGAGATVSWKYWNGTTWAALTVTDGTTNFTVDGQVTWTAPGDWATTTVNGVSAYWVRAVPSGAFGTAPTAVWASTADVWTNAGAGTFALHFATLMDGATAKIARAYSTNLVALASTSPTTAGSWGSGFSVGDTSYPITGLAENAMGVFVAKSDNLYLFDPTGVASPIFNLPSLQNSSNGIGLVAIPGTNVALYNHGSGLWAVEGDLVLNISPDMNPILQEMPNVSGEPFRGYHYYTAVIGSQIYSTYVTADASATYILAGQMLRGIRQIKWHSAQSYGTEDIGGLFIDTLNNLWAFRNTGMRYYRLATTGSPNAGGNSLGQGAASTQHRLFLPEVHLDAPFTTKQLMVMEVKTRGVDATSPVQLQIAREGAAPANVGAPITAAGVSKRYWTLGTNDTGIDLRSVIDITTTAGYDPLTADPQVWALALRVVPRPTRGDVLKIIIDTLAPYSNGAAQINSPLTTRAALKALENAAPVAARDPNGNTTTIQITSVNDMGLSINEDGSIAYLLEVEADQFVNA